MRTAEARRDFLEAKMDLSGRTLEQYSRALELLERECPELPDSPQGLRRALGKVSSIWVRDSYWRAWSAFFHWCGREYGSPNAIERVERPRRPQVEMRALELGELARVLAAATVPRDRAVLALALDAGVRGSEFGRLRIMDIGTDTIRVWGKGNRQEQVPISPETGQLLRRLVEQDGQAGPQAYLFPDHSGKLMSRHTVYRIVRGCMEKAGIPGPKLGPHCLRHSLGRAYIANGGDAFTLQRIMRHKSVQTTQRYVNLAMRDVIEQHHRHSPLREALRAAQGTLWHQVEEILETKGG